MNNYFANCITEQDIKMMYKDLAMKNHPDRGGDTATMQDINAQYAEACSRAKGFEGEAKPVDMTDNFMDIISQIITLQDITIEICGSWIWITGETYPVKDTIKKAGFRFSRKKTAWYYRKDDGKKYRRGTCTMDQIRQRHGSTKIAGKKARAIA